MPPCLECSFCQRRFNTNYIFCFACEFFKYISLHILISRALSTLWIIPLKSILSWRHDMMMMINIYIYMYIYFIYAYRV